MSTTYGNSTSGTFKHPAEIFNLAKLMTVRAPLLTTGHSSTRLLIAMTIGLLSNGLAANEGHQWLSYLGSRLQEQIN